MLSFAPDFTHRPVTAVASPVVRGVRAVIALLTAAAWSGVCAAAVLTPDLQKQVRAATFEVVTRKPQKDALTYEKPLPVELIPFVERNDAYWPIGTAFAIAPGTFVTAAHVMVAGVGSQFGLPAIRDTEGKVYTVDRILKFALHEDFVVFSVTGAPVVTPFATSTTPSIDDPVFAVGNALGEGVVIRDGLLTSRTPEPQDGRWKWLRFSAAASPGNSGGPLLDTQGRVIGVVAAKSPNENLNYALPIENVLNGSDKLAVFDARQSFGIVNLIQGTIVDEFKESFALPLPFPEFAARTRVTFQKHIKEELAKLVTSEAERLFPRGESAKLLATLYQSFDPSMVTQQHDGSWDAHSCGKGEETQLLGDGRVWHCQDAAAGTLFRITYPGAGADEHRYRDSKGFMDLLLKGVNLPRMVGPQAVRITSFGPAQQDVLLRDHFGRVWQLRTWSLGYADAYVVVLALPTPDGYVGLLNFAQGFLLDPLTEVLGYVANYLYLSYSGSLPQWRAFLDRQVLRPAAFDRIKLQYDLDKGLRFDSPRLQLDSTGLLPVGAHSSLGLQMTYMMDHGKLTWDVGGLVLWQVQDRRIFVAAYRQPKPADDAGRDLRDRWQHMKQRDGEFAGIGHDDAYKNFWTRTVAGGTPLTAPLALIDPDSRPLYEVVYNTDSEFPPPQLASIQAKLREILTVTE